MLSKDGVLDMRLERRVGSVVTSSSDASSSDSFSGISLTSVVAVSPTPCSSCLSSLNDAGTGFSSSSGESDVSSVVSLTGRVDGGLGTFRLVKDLAELVSTASSKVSYKKQTRYVSNEDWLPQGLLQLRAQGEE